MAPACATHDENGPTGQDGRVGAGGRENAAAAREHVFLSYRDLLMGVAYRVLGRVGDAEDVVQEAWLRWSKADDGSMTDPEAFLVTVTTRLAIDRLRRVQSRRETYVGKWLPEPLLTASGTDGDPVQDVLRNESVVLGLLVVLETLSPLERAVFVLHEVFEWPYSRIGAALDKSDAAVRQLASRARTHVRRRRPRFELDPITWRRVTDRFIGACMTGEMEGLLELLAPDVRLITDGGGKAMAPHRTIAGAEQVARFLLRILRFRPTFKNSIGVDPTAPVDYRLVTANAGPAIIVNAADRPIACFQLQITDRAIGACYLIVNPEKLAGVMSQDGPVLRP
ncbi:MAG: RNA polymerase sigma factor SigJ [Stackebrandtia sp.]